MSNPIPTGKFKRAGVAGLAAAKIGVQQLGHLSKRPFLSRQRHEAAQQEIDRATAETIFNTLSHLRGTALKVAQMLSMETDLLPERYRQELAKSYYQVPPLNRALIRKVMINELGDNPEKIFASFDGEAFAAASLGQVHHATDRDNRNLAVKVQYPGIGATIRSDIQMVKKLVRPLGESALLIPILNEIEARLQEETDYLLEAENARWFKQQLEMPQVIIPDMFDAVSSKHLLSMEYLDGLHLTPWLQTNPSQELCDHYAQLIYDLYMRSVFELHRLHADPNPGNYLFCEDGKLGVIDFGCIKTLSPEFSHNLSLLYKAVLRDDPDRMFDTYREMGMINSSGQSAETASYYEEVIKPIGDWLSLPFKQESFNFSEHPGYASRGMRLYHNIKSHAAVKEGLITLNPDFIFTDRTLYGLYKIFEEMGATVRMQNRWTYEA